MVFYEKLSLLVRFFVNGSTLAIFAQRNRAWRGSGSHTLSNEATSGKNSKNCPTKIMPLSCQTQVKCCSMPFRSLSCLGITFKNPYLPEKKPFFVHSVYVRKRRSNGVSRCYQNNTVLPAQASPERAEREACNHINTLCN